MELWKNSVLSIPAAVTQRIFMVGFAIIFQKPYRIISPAYASSCVRSNVPLGPKKENIPFMCKNSNPILLELQQLVIFAFREKR